MSKLVLIGTVTVVSGEREAILPALLAHRERCLRSEPGTLEFEVLRVNDDADRLMVYEVYADANAFDAHNKGASMAQMLAEVGNKIANFTATACAPATLA